MKKLLFLTALTVSLAMAENTLSTDERVMYTSEVTYGSNHQANITTKIGADKIDVSSPTFTCVDVTNTESNIDFIGTSNAMGVDVGSGGGFVLALTFPVDTQYSNYTVENISFVFGLNDTTGQTYYLNSYTEASGIANPGFNLNVRVKQGDTVYANLTTAFVYSGDATKYTLGFQLEEPIELKGSFMLEITVDGDERAVDADKDSSFYVSVDQVDISGKAPKDYTIPEPTTATLSLLALAGLATRRRRK